MEDWRVIVGTGRSQVIVGPASSETISVAGKSVRIVLLWKELHEPNSEDSFEVIVIVGVAGCTRFVLIILLSWIVCRYPHGTTPH